jgi:hypothetical protein
MPDVTPGARDGSYKKLTGQEGKRKELDRTGTGIALRNSHH